MESKELLSVAQIQFKVILNLVQERKMIIKEEARASLIEFCQ